MARGWTRDTTRNANGANLSYVEAYQAIAEANRIFGFDGLSPEFSYVDAPKP